MEIIVDIGDENTKQKIQKELNLILVAAEAMKLESAISRIIVPYDFEAKVKEMTNEHDYKSLRGLDEGRVSVAAKILDDGDGIAIVVAPYLYLPTFDTMIRFFVLNHELAHILNKSRFPEIPKGSFAQESYLSNLYQLFDEYFADRLSFQITEKIFSPPTAAWKKYNENGVLNYINPTNHPASYAQIKSEIEKFRIHADVDLYWRNISETVNVISMTTTHGFATYHQHLNEHKALVFPNTPFINERTIALMDYFKMKYENGETDLNDGMGLMEAYMTNFGVKFEDRLGNLGYIYVLDI